MGKTSHSWLKFPPFNQLIYTHTHNIQKQHQLPQARQYNLGWLPGTHGNPSKSRDGGITPVTSFIQYRPRHSPHIYSWINRKTKQSCARKAFVRLQFQSQWLIPGDFKTNNKMTLTSTCCLIDYVWTNGCHVCVGVLVLVGGPLLVAAHVAITLVTVAVGDVAAQLFLVDPLGWVILDGSEQNVLGVGDDSSACWNIKESPLWELVCCCFTT